MQTPQLNDGQFGSAANFSAAFAAASAGLAQVVANTHTPGLVYPQLLGITESGMTLTLTATSAFGVNFGVVFGDGVSAQMLGTTAGSTSNTATVNLASLVPGSGSVTAYVVAAAAQVQQLAAPVLGPPSGHPDYDPTFAPYTGYDAVDDTLVFTGTLTPPDNATYIEICRTTLTAGQVTITTVDTSHQVDVGSMLSQGQAAANVGALGGCLTGTLPNPSINPAAIAALFSAVVAVPGSLEVPTTAGTLIIQWGFAVLANGASLQTTIQAAVATPWPHGFVLGFCEDSGGAPSFQYTCSAGVDNDHVTINCGPYFIQGGSIASRGSIPGTTSTLGVWIAFGY